MQNLISCDSLFYYVAIMKKRYRIKITIGLLVSLLIFLSFVLVLIKLRQPPPTEIVPDRYSSVTTKPEDELKEIVPEYRARVAIVIDDLGYDKKVFRSFVDLGIPITFSILPGARFSKHIASEAKRLNYEVILHLPMQPHNPAKNPGYGAISLDMSRDEMLRQLSEDIEAVPYINGVNNHMGSHLTENWTAMNIILEDLHRRGLFFLDSMTSPHSVAYNVAKRIGVKSGKRDVFLDNKRDIGYIKGQIDEAIRIAKLSGEATVIGHPRRETVAALREKISDFKKEGIELVVVSTLLD